MTLSQHIINNVNDGATAVGATSTISSILTSKLNPAVQFYSAIAGVVGLFTTLAIRLGWYGPEDIQINLGKYEQT